MIFSAAAVVWLVVDNGVRLCCDSITTEVTPGAIWTRSQVAGPSLAPEFIPAAVVVPDAAHERITAKPWLRY